MPNQFYFNLSKGLQLTLSSIYTPRILAEGDTIQIFFHQAGQHKYWLQRLLTRNVRRGFNRKLSTQNDR
jgi:hypothetical protein